MSKINSEYAKALFMLAMENESVTEYGKALDFVSAAFHVNPVYIEFLNAPAISVKERLNALENVFSGTIPNNVLLFLKLLCKKRNIGGFFDCVEQYKSLANNFINVSKAEITSAALLNEKEKTALKEKLERLSGHTVITEYTIDKSILGGIIVEMDGKVIDSSLKKHLKDVKDVISK